MRGRGLGVGLAALLVWLVGYPLLITLLEALGFRTGWTLEYLAEFARRPDEWGALINSLWISAASVALAAAIGVPMAFVFERSEFPGRRILGGLVALPVALPPLVGVIAFLFLYGKSGFVTHGVELLFGLEEPPWQLKGPGAILLVHAYSMYVYFYLFARAALSRLDASVLEAAANLGAGRLRILLRVTLPLLRPALIGAALLTFMTSLASFSAPYLFGGDFRVMTTQIFASKLTGQSAMAYTETVVLAVVALLGLWLMLRLDQGRTAVVGGVRGIAPSRRAIRRPAARWAAMALGWGLALLLLLPHVALILISFVPAGTWTVELFPPVLDVSNYAGLVELEAGESVLRALGRSLRDGPLRPVVNSLWMALAATLGAVLLGLAAARSSLRLRGRLGSALEALISVPWAVPGTVFAVSLATAFSVSAPHLGRFVLVGTPWILPLAYLVRSLPVTGRAAMAGLRQMDGSLEEAAASLGAGRLRSFWRVTLPVLRPALAAGAGLAFITALGDFVTSIILYTIDTRPIAMQILTTLREAKTGAAAVYGVLLMVVSAAAFLLWGREQSA